VLFVKGVGGTELKTPPRPESKSVLDWLTSGKKQKHKKYTLFHYLVLCTVTLNISYNSMVTIWKNLFTHLQLQG